MPASRRYPPPRNPRAVCPGRLVLALVRGGGEGGRRHPIPRRRPLPGGTGRQPPRPRRPNLRSFSLPPLQCPLAFALRLGVTPRPHRPTTGSGLRWDSSFPPADPRGLLRRGASNPHPQPHTRLNEAGGHTTRGCVCAFAGHWYLCPPRRPCNRLSDRIASRTRVAVVGFSPLANESLCLPAATPQS
jgi:hypothetical protein